MLKFADLSKSQKTFIVRMLEEFPTYAKEKTLGAKQIHAAYFKLKDSRSSTGEKLGYPNWLQNKNRIDRGTYQMPWPTQKELSDFAAAKSAPKAVKAPKVKQIKVVKVKQPKVVKAKAQPKQDDKSRLEKIINESEEVDQDVEDFNQILRENGITV
jgi:hypothetical protein